MSGSCTDLNSIVILVVGWGGGGGNLMKATKCVDINMPTSKTKRGVFVQRKKLYKYNLSLMSQQTFSR